MARPPLLVIGRYPDWDLQPMRQDFDVTQLAGPEEIAGLDAGLRGVVRAIAYRSQRRLGGAEMDLLQGLGLVAKFGVGFEAIDVAAARARGVRVTNTPDVLSDDVADLAVAMLIAQARRMLPATRYLRAGRWAKEGPVPLAGTVSGRRVGIVGLGRIGRAIADRLTAFKMEIHYHSRAPKPVPEDWRFHDDPVSLAAAVDFLVVAIVGGSETEGYVSAQALSALGSEGIVVNISRGSTIDEAAMLDALEAGRLGGAALDVFRGEPEIDPRFLKLENVLALPHIGSATVSTRQAMGALQRANIAAFHEGRAVLTPVV
ncbi:2-hydroxyacid dehydrogenase [Tropicimonas sp. TH_r6]|uniref:2-hydroxyacid dehydrogenase n=1 Tax=Tropicimonas sp. TH_r6 TaxID=3082085 RepID=UPI002955D4C3|nr:2-hydroxyacid dehydrogenase [Tropicimonas sp. TH_r6]MDV7142886.1 2-hydroxyacid dehydrogenase [Tropicimonas sp. TH_r6]